MSQNSDNQELDNASSIGGGGDAPVNRGNNAPRGNDAADEDDVIAELFGDERDEVDEEDDDGEDLFGDNMERDYRAQPELDVLSQSGIDDEDQYSELSFGARRAAEAEMAERDQMTFDDRHLFYDAGDASQSQSQSDTRRRRSRFPRNVVVADDDDEVDLDTPIDILDNTRGRSIRDHVNDEAVAREIVRRFKRFLRHFKDVKGGLKYVARIQQMAADNKESLVVDYTDLVHADAEPVIAFFLPDAPLEIVELLDMATTDVVKIMYPHYERICSSVHVRIAEIPSSEHIRMLRTVHLHRMIRTSGVVTVTTSILPRLSMVKYNCVPCGYVIGPITQGMQDEIKPSTCPSCQVRGPFELNSEETVYQNYQRITIQESPNLIDAGRIPRSKDVIVTGDLCDACKPGDEIELTGVYSINYDSAFNARQGFPTFAAVIVANYIRQKDQLESDALTDEDIRTIHELSRDPKISKRIYASIAPTIYGHDDIKKALTLALFRGESKNPAGKHAIRGDINILLCGDPGTAKSQFLRYIGHLAPRAVLTTGQGASAVGLTAYVQRHPVTREWTLEAGAMVIADKGVCLIDEFDKMNEQDRTSIYEAMEQQSISISKAGIVTSLRARCTVIAAANPIGGRYDSSRTFADNVDLTEPILSRFDVLCVVRDQVDPVKDGQLAHFVIANHVKMHSANNATDAGDDEEDDENDENTPIVTQCTQDNEVLDVIPQNLLRKYITYARDHIHPKLEAHSVERIESVYAQLRKESKATGSVAITVRHIESMIRMSEAHAKLHLRSYVNDNDVNVAIGVMLESFVQTQKASVMRQMKKTFSRYLNRVAV